MEASSMRRSASSRNLAGLSDWGGAAIWLLCFALVAYLGLEGGGYDPLVHDQAGIAVWWLAIAAVAAGALPRGRVTPVAWAALALLAAFAIWTALSLQWTESVARTWADVARVTAYLGVFAVAVVARAGDRADRLVSAVAAGIATVALVGLLSRLHPAWFPDAGETVLFIDDSRERLSYPLNYWNGLAALIAIGLPLLLHVAAEARTLLARGLAAAALPALLLTIFFTLSRGGIAAAALALALYLALAGNRLPKLLALGVAGGGGLVLVAAAAQRDALQEGLGNSTAEAQGDEMLVIALAVCAAVGLAQAAIGLAAAGGIRPDWTRPTQRQSLAVASLAVVAAVVVALALDAPGRAADGWDEFKRGDGPGAGTGRLGSVAGQSRYELWQAALDQNATKPLTGRGSGTFELWWARNGTTDETVRDTHSLYLQTLGELGIVGLILLGCFLLLVLGGGGWLALRARPPDRSSLAAAIAGCGAFCMTAVVDWMWQMPVLAVSMLVLAAVAVGSALGPSASIRGLPLAGRIGLVAAGLVAIVAIALPLASTTLLRQSEAKARDGDLRGALEEARSAQNVLPGSGPPRLQQALVAEEMGDLGVAAAFARQAVDREPTDWRNWLILARVEARQGKAAAAVRTYEKARSLNPRSPVFEP
jgi:O-antigen ligase